jgi:alkylhydroperoxidase family enzyme
MPQIPRTPRIPYLPEGTTEPRAIVEAIRARRGGRLIELDRMLLHSPPLAAGWNAMLGPVRTQLALPARLRELAMCAVAVLNRAEYEFFHHAPLFIEAGGNERQVAALRDPDAALSDATRASQASLPALFDESERAALALTIESTRHVRVSDDTFEAVRRALPDHRQVVELVGVIAAYNMVSRFLVGLGIEPE